METKCRFFAQGYCKYGDECRFSHSKRNSREPYAGYTQKYYEDDIYEEDNDLKYREPSRFIPQNKNRFQAFNQHSQIDNFQSFNNQADKYNRHHKIPQQDSLPIAKNDKYHYYKQNNSLKPTIKELSTEEQLLVLQADMNEWKDSKMWLLSSYSLQDSKKSLHGLEEFSFEEIRFALYSDPSSIKQIENIFNQQIGKINICMNPDANEKINLMQAIQDSLDTENMNTSVYSITNGNAFQIKNSKESSSLYTTPIIFGAASNANHGFQLAQQHTSRNLDNIFQQTNSQLFPKTNSQLYQQQTFASAHQLAIDPSHNADIGKFGSPAVTQQVTNQLNFSDVTEMGFSGESMSVYSSKSLLSQPDIDEFNRIDFNYVPLLPPSIDFI